MTALNPTIRPFEPADQPAVEQILATLWDANDFAAEYYRFGVAALEGATRFLRTLVAEIDGQIVGFGSLWTSPVHPHTLYGGIQVYPAWQRQGIGTLLYAALMQMRGRYTGYPLQTATWKACTGAIRFLTRQGFYESKATTEPIFKIADLDPQCYAPYTTACAAAGYQIASLVDLAARARHQQKLLALVVEIYHATHRENPPIPPASVAWESLVLDSDALEAGSFVVYTANEYVACGFLHPHRDSQMLWFGWHGVTQAHRQHEREILVALAWREILYARQQGYSAIQAEVDTTNPWMLLLRDSFPALSPRAWITLRKPADGAAA